MAHDTSANIHFSLKFPLFWYIYVSLNIRVHTNVYPFYTLRLYSGHIEYSTSGLVMPYECMEFPGIGPVGNVFYHLIHRKFRKKTNEAEA